MFSPVTIARLFESWSATRRSFKGSAGLLPAVALVLVGAVAPATALADQTGGSSAIQPDGWTPRPGFEEQALAPVPGADIQLGGFNEPNVVVDPNNPMNVAYAGLWEMRVSTDGGQTFGAVVAAQVDADAGLCGDPSLAFDSQGRLFWSYLGCNDSTGNPDVYISQLNPATGAHLPGYPINVTAQLGWSAAGGQSHDKQWLSADINPASPYTDRLYLTWIELTGASTIWSSYSTDQGLTWSAPVQLSGGGEGFVWPCHNAVAPNGDVYAGYHSQTGYSGNAPDGTSGCIWVLRSTDGGVSFPQKNQAFAPGDADITFNVQSAANPIANTQFWLQGSAQPWILPDPNVAGRVYVVANDDPDDDHSTGDPANVYMVTSSNSGVNWGAPVRIDGDGGAALQAMPTAGIDPFSGRIAVTYYDTRNGATNSAGRLLLDVFMTYSDDGGVTWEPDFTINDRAFDPDPGARVRFNGPPPTTRIGEYNGVAVLGCFAYTVWTGNVLDGLGNPIDQQTIFDRILIDEAAPVVNCPVAYQVNTDPGDCTAIPDLTMAAITTSDDCSDVTLSFSPPNGSVFGIGSTMVTVTATDEAGNSSVCNFDLVVVDNEAPVITCPADLAFECDNIGPFGSPTATDNCDPNPAIMLTSRDSTAGPCPQEYTLQLTYQASDVSGNSSYCQQTITVIDTTPPVVTCYDTLGFVFTSPTEAEVYWDASATDNCGTPTVTCDPASGTTFGIGLHAVTCIADDGCANADTCSFRFRLVPLDLHPTSCPNPVAVKSVLPAALVGTADFDVQEVNVSSLRLNGVAPERWALEDVTRPVANDPNQNCECTTEKADGIRDLTLKFNREDVIAAIPPALLVNGGTVMLQITGEMTDGTPLAGGDCLTIRLKPKEWTTTDAPVSAEELTSWNSPNPFNPTTVIYYTLPQPGHVSIAVFNMLGQEVTRLVDVWQEAGQHAVEWSGDGVASGVYLYRLETTVGTITEKMLLLK